MTAVAPATDAAFEILPIGMLVESPKNPRKHFDAAKLQELKRSIEAHGVLTPLLARPVAPQDGELVDEFELAAGHRRYRAAKLAGVDRLPVLIRHMTDVEFLEVLTIENLQRDDVHPLEEAQGYQDLIKEAGYSAERIAERVGKSVKYVYDRIKLLQLTPDAKALFFDGKITAGHAILIARLPKDVQKTVIDQDEVDRNGSTNAPLWQSEHAQYHPLFGRDEDDDRLKAKSVRELEAWIEDHVRIGPKDRDPLLFPEMAAVVGDALDMQLKVEPITYEHMLKDSARSETEKTYGPQSWERADGKHGSKTCEFSVTGYVAAGAGRGEAFSVCIAKEKCKTHWPEQFKRAQERKKAAKKVADGEAKKPSASAAEKAERERKAIEAQQAKEKAEAEAREAERKRFTAALPKILDRFADVLSKASAGPSGMLAAEIKGCMQEGMAWDAKTKAFKVAEAHMGKGKTAEDLVRLLAFASIVEGICGHHGEFQRNRFVSDCKRFGFDVKKALDEISPAAEKKPAAKSAKKKSR